MTLELDQAIDQIKDQSLSLSGEAAKEAHKIATWLEELKLIKGVVYSTDTSDGDYCSCAIKDILDIIE